jgi:TrpR-related protein YerC/YecD
MTKNQTVAKSKKLFEAFLFLKKSEEVARFCRDLMTEQEIEEFASRWEVAQELYKGNSQRNVSTKTGVSIATVTRVNQWLKRGKDGYRLVLERMNQEQPLLSVNR